MFDRPQKQGHFGQSPCPPYDLMEGELLLIIKRKVNNHAGLSVPGQVSTILLRQLARQNRLQI
jgi:hypothetical protein